MIFADVFFNRILLRDFVNKIPFEIPTTAQSRYREIPFSLSSEPGKREQPSVNAACDDGFVSRRIFVIDRSSRISFLVDTDVYPRNRLRGPASRSQYDDDLIVLLVRAIWAVLVLFAYSPDSTSLITRATLAATVSNCVFRFPSYRLPGFPKEKVFFRDRQTDLFLSKALAHFRKSQDLFFYDVLTSAVVSQVMRATHPLNPGTFFTAMGRYRSIRTFMLGGYC